MKQQIISVCVVLFFLGPYGCATSVPLGIVYTEVTLPVIATEAGGSNSKTGVAECMSVLALVATGDCSIETAKANGGITKVHRVDWEANNVLGVLGRYKVVVHGK